MRRFLYCIFLATIIGVVFYYRTTIANYLTNKVILPDSEPPKLSYNNYKYGDWLFVHNIEDLTAYKYEDFKNIFYTILNSGKEEFSFNCSDSYTSCTNDVQTYISSDPELGNINNLVHPYNSFKNIQVTITNHGKITVKVNHIYTNEQIDFVNSEIRNFITNNITDNMSDNDKIQKFHDYIINNTKYDQNSITPEEKLNLSSYNAFGLLTNHKAICGGYTDVIAIYLNMLGYQNYRVATNEHIWNLVNINGNYLHIDATWDDPVTSNGSDQLLHDFFLINNQRLQQLDKTQHVFDTNIYIEGK